ncbi:MAG: branched-chain amino acid ABC transporter permease [Bacilli bacterium]|nr:branched-chain amino acid ABC transporter permease [Bacilli bacterium]
MMEQDTVLQEKYHKSNKDKVKKFFKKHKPKKYINYVAIIICIVIFLISSGGMKRVTCTTLNEIAISILLAVSLGLVIGFLGELSLGHAGFMCIGAYIGGKVALLLQPYISSSFILLVIALIVGGVAAALAGVLIGLPALRLKGDYLAIVTLAFGEIVRSVFRNINFFGGVMGMDTKGIQYDVRKLFIIGFFLILIMLAVIQNIVYSKHGRAITAIRDSEIASKATGINVTRYKIFVFAISAFFAGLAGVIYAFCKNPTADAFSYNKSIEVLVMVVLGGMGNVNGSILSATLITFLNLKLPTWLPPNLAVLKNILYSLILIVIVIYNNAPKLKSFRDKYNFKNLMNKIFKPKDDASIIKNDANKWDRIPTKIEMNEVLSVDVNVEESTTTPDVDKGGR